MSEILRREVIEDNVDIRDYLEDLKEGYAPSADPMKITEENEDDESDMDH